MSRGTSHSRPLARRFIAAPTMRVGLRILVILWLGIAQVMAAEVNVKAENEKIFSLNIQQTKAAVAIKKLSRQTGYPVIFQPADVVNIETNLLRGSYTLNQALTELFKGTSLAGGLSKRGVLVISLKGSETPDNNRKIESEDKMNSKKSMLATLIGFFVGASGSQAATEVDRYDAEQAAAMLEEVIVTATRREARLQDIPISINAFSGERLKESGIEDIRDLQAAVAGMQVTNTSGLTRVTVRGISNTSFSLGAESGVAVHRNGVYLQTPYDVGMGFFDVERIEVLRGPQGTLYGRNATGGAVNIISRAPTRDFQAGGSVTVGNYDLIETEGYVSGPLVGEKMMARVAFKARDHDGYTPNHFNGERYDDEALAALRATVLYEPSENFSLNLGIDFARDNGRPFPIMSKRDPNVLLDGETLGGTVASDRTVNLDNDMIQEKSVGGVGGRAEWDMGAVKLTSLTGYREAKRFDAIDLDGTDASVVFIKEETRDSAQLSQELTLASSAESDLQWIVGGFYFHTEESAFLDIPIPPIATSVEQDIDVKSSAYAVFGDVSYPVFPRLELTFGARYSYEQKFINQSFTIFGTAEMEQLEDSWGSFTPKAAIIYAVNDDVSAYFAIGKGFKAGGYNGGTLQGQAFDPEEVLNYEVGLKSSLFDDCLRVNAAFFHMNYSDLQVQVRRESPLTNTLINLIDNAGKSVIHGVEFEFEAKPTRAFSMEGTMSYLDAKFKEWRDAVDGTRGGAEFDVSGNRMPNAPEWAVNFGAKYSVPVGGWGSATLRGEYSYKSRVYFSPFEDEFLSQDRVGLTNASLTIAGADGMWSIAAWAKNLADKLVASDRRASAATSPVFTDHLPSRTYGVTVGYKF